MIKISFLICFLVPFCFCDWTYWGVNEAALGWGPSALPGMVGRNYPLIAKSSIDYFASKKMNVIRVSFIWERMQPVLNNGYGDFNITYLGYLDDAVNYATTTKGMYCIVDLHNYNRYRGEVIGSANVSYNALANFWYNLAYHYKNNPLVIFGLMNEPYDVPYLSVQVSMNAALEGVRRSGATQLCLVPGNDFTGVQYWVGRSGDWMGPSNITDSKNNWMYEMHQYFDGQGGNTVCKPNFDVSAAFTPATNWARQNGKTIFLGEFGINDSPDCLKVLRTLLQFLKDNSDVWKGWTWWSAGPWWDPSYVYLLEPFANGTDRNQLMGVLQSYFPEPVSTTATITSASITTAANAPNPNVPAPSSNSSASTTQSSSLTTQALGNRTITSSNLSGSNNTSQINGAYKTLASLSMIIMYLFCVM